MQLYNTLFWKSIEWELCWSSVENKTRADKMIEHSSKHAQFQKCYGLQTTGNNQCILHNIWNSLNNQLYLNNKKYYANSTLQCLPTFGNIIFLPTFQFFLLVLNPGVPLLHSFHSSIIVWLTPSRLRIREAVVKSSVSVASSSRQVKCLCPVFNSWSC